MQGEVWQAPVDGAVELFLIRLDPPGTLSLGFSVDASIRRVLVFEDVADIQLDGPLFLGDREAGWDVLEMSMLVRSAARDDGRLVYFMELANANLCFASRRGADAVGGPVVGQ